MKRDNPAVSNRRGPAGIDANALLTQLNREFVLLDGETFRSFIDSKALDRGRDFAGLLGLARYSVLRQQLQALANTRAAHKALPFDRGSAHPSGVTRPKKPSNVKSN